MRLRPVLLAAALLLPPASATAHPHVWIAARATVVFDADGRITGLRHDWTFDEMYSSFAAQGLGKDGKPPTREELAPLAKTNIESLEEFDYFTAAKDGGRKLTFAAPVDYWLEADDRKIVSLHLTLPLKEPLAAKTFSFQVFDPTYFVAFGFEKKEPVTMSGAPPGCSISVVEPPPLVASESRRLSDAATQNFSPGADLSARIAPRVVVACP